MSTELAVQPVTPMELLQSAVSQGASIDTIERLAKLQREMLEYDAKVAFDMAMHQAQSKMRRIEADATNPQTRSKYATYAALDRVLRPIYSAEGLAVSFNTADAPADTVRVLAYVSHTNGHTRTYQIDMPADGKGAKGADVMTKTHATGAATSYGSRYLLKMIFNVAVGEDDDDGNGAGPRSQRLEMSEIDRHISLIEATRTMDELKTVYATAYKTAEAIGDRTALKGFIAAYGKRKAELL